MAHTPNKAKRKSKNVVKKHQNQIYINKVETELSGERKTIVDELKLKLGKMKLMMLDRGGDRGTGPNYIIKTH